MAFFSEISEQVEHLRELVGAAVEPTELAGAVSALTDAKVVDVLARATSIVRTVDKLRIVASGVAARRSTRHDGHGGLAQTRGHRTPISLVQEIMGSTRADAAQRVRLGESLLDAAPEDAPPDEPDGSEPDAPADAGTDDAAREPWHAPLGRALLAGDLSSAQHEAILRGLGEPPRVAPDSVTCSCRGEFSVAEECACVRAAEAAVADAWSVAAEQLIHEAAQRTVEELRRTARGIRDRLDPIGADERFRARFDNRSFRTWVDADGVRRGSIVFDDEGGAWLQSVLDAALRPRRGGPRFVDPDEKARGAELAHDPRTNDQLTYDLFVDVFRAGTLAEPAAVFGTRQAGVRVVTIIDSANPADSTSHFEDDGTVVPPWLVAQSVCDTGSVPCEVDRAGNPLYLGREARVFSAKQRIALAIRDGGCRWRGCDRPPSYCEAHHIDEFARDQGCTDIDRGVLLCRFHHMQLHHGGWRITRDGLGDFILRPPPGQGQPVVLEPRLALRYAWAGIDPPPKRFVLAA